MINNEGRAVEGIDTRALNTFSEELIKIASGMGIGLKIINVYDCFFLYLHGKLEKNMSFTKILRLKA